jgi:hypothetical protein
MPRHTPANLEKLLKDVRYGYACWQEPKFYFFSVAVLALELRRTRHLRRHDAVRSPPALIAIRAETNGLGRHLRFQFESLPPQNFVEIRAKQVFEAWLLLGSYFNLTGNEREQLAEKRLRKSFPSWA